MTHREDLAWAAGFFEGEGCWYLPIKAKSPRNRTLRASLGQKGLEGKILLERFKNIVGMGEIYISNSQKLEPNLAQYNWQTTQVGQPVLLFEKIGEWLGKRRASRFNELLKLEEEILEANPPKRGGPKLGQKRGPYKVRQKVFNERRP